MSDQKSLSPLLQEIATLSDHIRNAEVPSEHEYKREQALTVLDSVQSLLKAFCLVPPSGKPYLPFEFPPPPSADSSGK